MSNRGSAGVLLFAGVLLPACLAAAQSTSNSSRTSSLDTTTVPAPSAVDALDRCIQERFRNLSNFGIGRMAVVPEHFYQFQPETPEEKAAVVDMEKSGWKAALYLGGRQLLNSGMNKKDWDKAGERGRAISKPLIVSGSPELGGQPQGWEFWTIAQQALAGSATGKRSTGTLGAWTVDVRPIPAGQAACLKCHNVGGPADDFGRIRPNGRTDKRPLKVGDALGVVVYVYGRPQK